MAVFGTCDGKSLMVVDTRDRVLFNVNVFE